MRYFSIVLVLLLSNNVQLSSENSEWKIYHTSTSGICGDNIRNIAIDSSNNIWLNEVNGRISKFDLQNWLNYDFEDSLLSTVHCIEVQSNGNVWLGGVSCILINENNNWTFYNRRNSKIIDSYIYSIAFDKNSTIYFGVQSNNFMILYNKEFKLINNEEGINEDVFALTIDIDGVIWIGSRDYGHSGSIGLLSYYSDNKWTNIFPKKDNNFPTGGVFSIRIDKYNNKWIAKDEGGGLIKFDDTVFTSYKKENSGLPHDDVYDIAIDENDVKWITTGGGLAKFDGTNWTVWNTTNSDLPNDRINCIVIDKYGNKWMGTDGGGVAVFREGGVVGIEEQTKNSEVSFSSYPNPAKDKIIVRYSNFNGNNIKITILDLLGNKIKSFTMEITNSILCSETLDISDVPSGIHFLKFESGLRVKTEIITILK